MSEPVVSLVCFDLGGVLVRICRSWAQACVEAGVAVREGVDRIPPFLEKNRLVQSFETGRIDADQFCQGASEAADGLYSRDEVRLILDAWVLDEQPGAVDLIEQLEEVGMATACLSNTNCAHWPRLVSTPAVSRLKHTCASHLLGERKPDRACLAAFERLTGAHGAEILFFDDLQMNVDAANRFGWRALTIDHEGDTIAQMTDALTRLDVL